MSGAARADVRLFMSAPAETRPILHKYRLSVNAVYDVMAPTSKDARRLFETGIYVDEPEHETVIRVEKLH